MIAGSIAALDDQSFGVIIGASLARVLGVSLGDKLTLIVPEMSVTIASIQPRFKRFTLVGIFKVGAELDSSLVITHIDDLAKLMLYGDAIDGLQLRTTDLFQARQIAFDIGRELPDVYFVSDWTRTQGNLFQAIQLEKRLVGLLLFMIVAVAVFNIVSSLVMLVTDKQGEIAVLRTLGATSRQILGVFMVQGTAIGLIGIAMGVLLGVIGALTVADIIAWFETAFDVQFLNSDVYFINYIPSELDWNDVLIISSATFIISVLSTIYPAWKASKISPAEVLRYES
jgi:lipoprotein-releasing system permease protein